MIRRSSQPGTEGTTSGTQEKQGGFDKCTTSPECSQALQALGEVLLLSLSLLLRTSKCSHLIRPAELDHDKHIRIFVGILD